MDRWCLAEGMLDDLHASHVRCFFFFFMIFFCSTRFIGIVEFFLLTYNIKRHIDNNHKMPWLLMKIFFLLWFVVHQPQKKIYMEIKSFCCKVFFCHFIIVEINQSWWRRRLVLAVIFNCWKCSFYLSFYTFCH